MMHVHNERIVNPTRMLISEKAGRIRPNKTPRCSAAPAQIPTHPCKPHHSVHPNHDEFLFARGWQGGEGGRRGREGGVTHFWA